MGLTYNQCKQLGIEHLWPEPIPKAHRWAIEDSDVLPPQPTRPADGMNKLERAFAETLAQAPRQYVAGWWREPLTFRLAGRTRYTPDFGVATHGMFYLIEVKGFMRDDAAVKIKVAADMYPCFKWLLVYRAGQHHWDVRGVTRTGIGTAPITIPWIEGS